MLMRSFANEIGKRPHKHNNLGMGRLGIDLVIMTLLFYMLSLTEIEDYKESYWHFFIWVLPSLFAAYCIWDFIEYKEYESSITEKEKLGIRSQFYKSLLGLNLTLYQAVGYTIAGLFFDQTTIYFFFTLITGHIVVLYRISNWKIARLKIGSVRKRT